MTEDISIPALVDETAQWITEMHAQGILRYELRCDRPGTALVKDWVFTAANDDAFDARKFAEQAVRLAQQDGRYMTGKIVFYELRGFRAGTDTDSGRTRIAAKAAGESRTAADDRVPGDAQQALGVMTKAVLELHKLLQNSENGRAERDTDMIKSLLTRIDENNRDRLNVVRLTEDLLSQQVARESARSEDQMRQKMVLMFGKQFEQLLPVAINRLAGGGPGTGHAFAGEQLVRQLLKSMTPSQLETFMGQGSNLTREQQILFGELFMTYSKMDEQKSSPHDTPVNPPPAKAEARPEPST